VPTRNTAKSILDARSTQVNSGSGVGEPYGCSEGFRSKVNSFSTSRSVNLQLFSSANLRVIHLANTLLCSSARCGLDLYQRDKSTFYQV
jgi:hypothetical protein